jgi:hypothetical protein
MRFAAAALVLPLLLPLLVACSGGDDADTENGRTQPLVAEVTADL